MSPDPHRDRPVVTAGAPPERAAGAVLMLHGRGAHAGDMIALAHALDRPHFSYIAPEAADHTWYPNRFVAPLDANEPWLSSALRLVERLRGDLERGGIANQRLVLLGFSQGACLALEFAARHARRYGGIAGLSGALIGPDGTPRDYQGSLLDTPVFLGCDDNDFHVPAYRVRETASVLAEMGARVSERLYSDLGHTVNEDEIERVREMLDGMGG